MKSWFETLKKKNPFLAKIFKTSCKGTWCKKDCTKISGHKDEHFCKVNQAKCKKAGVCAHKSEE